MKIKPPSKKHLLKSKLRQLSTHYWLVPETPKSKGRLAQLNKANRKQTGPNEFQLALSKEDGR